MDFGCGRGVFGFGGCASGGAGEAEELPAEGLVVVVVGDGLRVGGIKIRGLIEVVRGKSLDDLVVLCLLMAHVEFGLGWAPGGMNQRRRGGLAPHSNSPAFRFSAP